ncbi:MAG: cell division protein FtsQ/DivIB [Brevinema sp.]
MRYKFSAILILILIPLSIFMHKGTIVVLNRYTNIFKIKHIDINGSVYSLDTSFKEYIRSLSNQSLLTLNIFDVRRSLLASPIIDNVIVNRDFPDKLSIEIIEKRPVAIIISENKQYVVDTSGTILPIKIDHLPKITVDFGIAIDQYKISDTYLIQMLSALDKPLSNSLDSIYINRNREASFRLKGLSSDFIISKRILTYDFIKKATLIHQAITNQNIAVPKKIDIHNNKENAIGIL